MTFEISQIMCFGKSLSWYDLLEKLHVTLLIFLIRGQYVHLPNLVQIVALFGSWAESMGGYLREALVSMSLRLGSLLNPITGFSLNRLPQFGLLLRMISNYTVRRRRLELSWIFKLHSLTPIGINQFV